MYFILAEKAVVAEKPFRNAFLVCEGRGNVGKARLAP